MCATELIFNALAALHNDPESSSTATVTRDDKPGATHRIGAGEQSITIVPRGGQPIAQASDRSSLGGREGIRELFDIVVRMSCRAGDLKATFFAMTQFVRAELAWLQFNLPVNVQKFGWDRWSTQVEYSKKDSQNQNLQPVIAVNCWAESVEIASAYPRIADGPGIHPWPPTRVIFAGDVSVDDYDPEGDEFRVVYDVPSTNE